MADGRHIEIYNFFFNKTANINVNNYNGRCCESREKGNRAHRERKWGSGGKAPQLGPGAEPLGTLAAELGCHCTAMW